MPSVAVFADRESDAARSMEVWQFLADRPEMVDALNWLRDRYRVTLAVRGTLNSSAHSCNLNSLPNIARSHFVFTELFTFLNEFRGTYCDSNENREFCYGIP
jgi:hypothetical protein